MRAKVVVSLEDAGGDRCVDILRFGSDQFAYRECRRDPEDNYGWRHLSGAEPKVYPSYDQAFAAARAAVGWLDS